MKRHILRTFLAAALLLPTMGLMAQVSIPYSQEFESISGSSLPAGWTHIGWGGTTAYSSNSYAMYGGSGTSLQFNYGSSYTLGSEGNIVVLPEFESEISGLQVSFWTCPEGYSGAPYANSGNFDVGYVTNATDASSFVQVDTWNQAFFTGLVGQELEAVFTNAPDGSRIAFRHRADVYNYYWFLDHVSVSVASDCRRVGALTVSNIGENEATISFTGCDAATAYSLVVSTTMLSDPSTATDPIDMGTDTSYTLTNLNGSTQYYIYIKTICGSDENGWTSATFRTECGDISTLPWIEGFESGANETEPECWVHPVQNSSSFNYCRVYNSTSHTGSRCLRFNYAVGNNVMVLPPFEAEISTLEISFWHRPESITNSYCGTLKVGYVTDVTDPTTFVPTASWAYSDFANTNYRQEDVSFAGAPEGARMAFCHVSESSVTGSPGYNWYWHVDDIDVHVAPACAKPVVVVDSITVDAVYLSINDANQTGSYKLVVGDMDTIDVSGNEYTVGNLSPNTAYSLMCFTTCDDGSLSTGYATTFRTACGVISSLPWNENFNSLVGSSSASEGTSIVNNLPCWTVNQAYSYYSFIYSSYNHDEEASGNSLRLYGSNTYPTYTALPEFEESIGNLMLSFYTYFGSSNSRLVAGYMTDAAVGSTFVAVDTIGPGSTATWEYQEVIFPEEAAGNIALRVMDASVNNIYIDNITVGIRPSCTRPQSVAVSGIGETEVTLNVNDLAGVDSYFYTLYSGSSVVDSGAFSGSTYQLSGLNSSTSYMVQVVAVCDDGTRTMHVSASFNTTCALLTTADLPYTENFDSYPSFTYTISPCWTKFNQLSNPTYDYPFPNANFAHGNSGTGLYFYSGSNQYSYAVMPPVEDLNGLMLNFWCRIGSPSSAQIQVGTMTNPSDASTFVPIYTTPTDMPSSTWTEIDVIVPSGTTAQFLAFRNQGSSAQSAAIDDVTLMEVSGCMRPALVSVTEVDDNSATVVVNDPGQVGNYTWVLLQGTTVVDSASISDTTFQLTNLTSATAYTVRVMTNCDDGTRTNATSTNFRTACGAIAHSALPWTEGFESYATGTSNSPIAVDCWVINNPYQSSYYYPYIMGSNAHSGSNCMFVAGSSSSNTWFVLPQFEDDLSALRLNVWLKKNQGGLFIVGYCTNPTDLSTFVAVDTTSGDVLSTSTMTEMEYTFPAEATGYIAFRTIFPTGYGFYIDDVTVSENNGCNRVQALSAGSTDGGEATVSFNGTAESYRIVWTDGTTTDSMTVSGSPATITGLNSSTTYTVTVYSICDGGATSQPSVVTFKTPCDVIAAFPWEENFDEIPMTEQSNIVSHGYQYLNCWNMKTGAYNATTGTSSANDATYDAFYLMNSNVMGSTHIRVNIYGESQYRWLVTPPMSIGSEGSLSFRYALTGYNSSSAPSSVDTDDKFYVLASTDGSTWSNLYAWGGNTTDFDALLSSMPATPDSISIDLGEYANQTIFIAFYSESTVSGSDNDIHLDNIRVVAEAGETPGPGPQPQPDPCDAPTVTNGTSTTNSVTLSWTSTATSFEVAIVEGAWSEPSETSSATGTQYTFNGLSAGTQYTAGVRTVCEDGQYSVWATRTVTTATQGDEPGPGPDGIEDAAAAVFALYPNPASTMVRIEVDGEARVAVIDQSGRTVASVSATGSADIDVSQLAKGAYYVRVSTADATAVRKLVVR